MNGIEIERTKMQVTHLRRAARSFDAGSAVVMALLVKAEELQAEVNRAETDGIPAFQVECMKCGAKPGVPCGHWEGAPVICQGGGREF